MKHYNSLLILILILIVILTGCLLGVFWHSNNKSLTATLTIQLVPEQKDLPALAQIDNDIIHYSAPFSNGKLSLAIPEGKYSLVISAPQYLNWSREIVLNTGQNVSIDQIYLLPRQWSKESILTNNNIALFQVNPDFNSLVYLLKKPMDKNKTNYLWHLFNRQNKKDLEFWQTNTLPEEINLSPKSKKVLARFKNNDWRLLFFTGEDIQSYALKELLSSKIKVVSPAESSHGVVITKAIFNPLDDEEMIIQTKEAIYFYNFIKDSLEKIYNGENSNFCLNGQDFYFIDSAYNLMRVSLESPHKLDQVSFFTFNIQDLTKIKLATINNASGIMFLIKDDKDQVLLFIPDELTPKIIAQDIKDISCSSDEQEILIQQQNNNVLILTTQLKKISEITSPIFPIKVFPDYWLRLKDNTLSLIWNNFKDEQIVIEDIKHQQLFFDSTLKQLFYLNPEENGISKISF